MSRKRSLERVLYKGDADMYSIDGPLGSGGMSSVVLATFNANGEIPAQDHSNDLLLPATV